MDILQNDDYSSRFAVVNLKQDFENICNDELGKCNGKFIGPIKKDKLSEEVFFVSFDVPGNIVNLINLTYYF